MAKKSSNKLPNGKEQREVGYISPKGYMKTNKGWVKLKEGEVVNPDLLSQPSDLKRVRVKPEAALRRGEAVAFLALVRRLKIGSSYVISHNFPNNLHVEVMRGRKGEYFYLENSPRMPAVACILPDFEQIGAKISQSALRVKRLRSKLKKGRPQVVAV